MRLTGAWPSAPAAKGAAERVAPLANAALIGELETWPKPGLVSPVDSGSHRDMDAGALARSTDAIRPFFAKLACAGARGAGLPELRRIGVVAELGMMAATGGVNAKPERSQSVEHRFESRLHLADV